MLFSLLYEQVGLHSPTNRPAAAVHMWVKLCKSACVSDHLPHTLSSTEGLLPHFNLPDSGQFDLIPHPDGRTRCCWDRGLSRSRTGRQQQKDTTRCHSHYSDFTADWASLVALWMPRLKSLKRTQQWQNSTAMIIMNRHCVKQNTHGVNVHMKHTETEK